MEGAGKTVMTVVDTDVFVYALLGVDRKCESAEYALRNVTQILVPDSMFSEIGNVV